MKLRRYHRWLAPVFAIVLLWIAVTGITIQVIRLQTPPRPGEEEARGPTLIPTAQAHEHEAPAAANIIPRSPGEPTPSAAAPKSPAEIERARLHDLSEFVMDLHSGKILGPVGIWLSILSGGVLIFLAGSGLWMYVQMYRRRTHRHSHPRRLFW